MKRTAFVLLAGAVLLAPAAYADTVSDGLEMTVSVDHVRMVEVPGAVGISLGEPPHAGEDAFSGGTEVSAGGLKLSHNLEETGVTVEADLIENFKDSDITLAVEVESEEGSEVVLVDDGTITNGGTLWTGGPGAYTEDLMWSAAGTVGETPPGDYVWQVTFTMEDTD